jgi:hypothetical protein
MGRCAVTVSPLIISYQESDFVEMSVATAAGSENLLKGKTVIRNSRKIILYIGEPTSANGPL